MRTIAPLGPVGRTQDLERCGSTAAVLDVIAAVVVGGEAGQLAIPSDIKRVGAGAAALGIISSFLTALNMMYGSAASTATGSDDKPAPTAPIHDDADVPTSTDTAQQQGGGGGRGRGGGGEGGGDTRERHTDTGRSGAATVTAAHNAFDYRMVVTWVPYG